MPTSKSSKSTRKRVSGGIDIDVEAVLTALRSISSKKIRDELGPRYGIHTDKALGIGMAAMQKVAKEFKLNARGDVTAMKRNHDLALALWDTGWYEARTVAALIDEPQLLTPTQMDRWCKDFDNWGICDTVCFKLFDQSPHAYGRVTKWAKSREEFVKRGAFALMACLALHDKGEEPVNPKMSSDDREEAFMGFLSLIERAATDERNFVKKGVSWALRAIGGRNRALHAAAIGLGKRLAESPNATARWVGKDALRALGSAAVIKRLKS